MDLVAIRARIEQLRTDPTPANHDELAQIGLRLAAHLEYAQERDARAKGLAAALEYRANAGTLDELLLQALANYRGG